MAELPEDFLDNIFAVILGGGSGSRLYPLTSQRSEPAVPVGGKYRLIDIPVSNCINSGIFRIAILTQYNSVSLHRHIAHAYKFDAFHEGGVEIWAAEQTIANAGWYLGTADAIRKRLREIRNTEAAHILILSGDHLYRMDYAALAQFHWDTQADITIAVRSIARNDLSRFGVLKCDTTKRINQFAEKPTDPELIKSLVSHDDPEKPYLASMGIYLFRTPVLIDLLERNTFTDFGSQVIPSALQDYAVYSYDFDGYWEDIGTIRTYYDTHIQLARPDPPFNFYDPENPIYSYASFLPSSVVENSVLEDVLLTEGSIIKCAEISRSVIGLRCQIGNGVRVTNSVLIGADYYSPPLDFSDQYRQLPPLGIGSSSQIDGAIIDKNVRIGENTIIQPFPRQTNIKGDLYAVQDGIVVIPKDTILPPGTHIGPDF